ncbi:MAG: MotA/TolQ/ExbB proton channel family protein [Planctomycetia bacterium]|nr:MotA/TolQ/ExbB proton channel family protein [Planctomycetia bacterium]
MTFRTVFSRPGRATCLVVAVLLVLFLQVTVLQAADTDAAAPKGESYLVWLAKSSGLIGVVILLLSMYFVATVIRLFIELREKVAAPPELLNEIEVLMQQRDFREVYKVVKTSESFLGRTLATGISELPNGIAEAREAMDRAADAVTMEMERMISMLAVLGTLGPMIGLLGTLQGMIASFSVIAMSGVELKANQVAAGISTALVLTFEGVALSVPAIYFFALFRNRISTISANTTLLADQILRRLYHSAQWKAAPPGQAPAGQKA